MRIRGAGGEEEGGGSVSSTEYPDSLRSRQYAKVIDLVSEGEIEGSYGGLQSVYLDDTPIQNPDGSYNFSNLSVQFRAGTQTQTYIEGFPSVEAESSVATEILYATPVVRSISNTNADAVRVTISIPRLTYQNTSNGDLAGTSVAIAIDVQNNGGGFVPQILGTDWVALSIASGHLQSTSNIFGASFTAEYNGINGSEYQAEYRLIGGGAWTVFNTGFVYPSTYMVYESDNDSGHLVCNPVNFSLSTPSLAEGLYEFRLLAIKGDGGVSFTSAYGLSSVPYDTISGKTTSTYQKAYRIELPPSGPWDIRVRRLTADSNQSNLQNRTIWDSYTEIVDAKLSYPNSALVAISFDSEQFGSIPKRGYGIKGIKVLIPSNYDPITRVYSGVWDGTFTVAWSNNPAWCYYDLITNDRYGLGKYIDESQIDKWGLYTIAQYCDEMVDNGFGGTEPRFTCNLYLQTRQEAFTVIQSMASIFRAMAYWAGGTMMIRQDAPSDPVALFTAANVIDGKFEYSGSSIKTRHTVALVAWNDPDDLFRQKIEYVEDEEGIELYGVQQADVVAVGCTSRGQAHRIGRWLLYTERMETETVSFRTGLEGAIVAPGEVIQTSDPLRSGIRMGGRIISATTTQITLDAPATIEAGAAYELWCVLPDGAPQTRAVTNSAGTSAVITVSPAYDSAPQDLSVYILSQSDLVYESWQVIGISEIDGTQAEITALTYNPDKFDAVENNLILERRQTSSLTASQPTISDVNVSESLYLITKSVVGTRMTISWLSDASRFEVSYRKPGDNWTTLSLTNQSLDVQPVSDGVYEIRIVAINGLGLRTSEEFSRVIYGLTSKPQNVSGLSLSAIGGMALLAFDPSADLDVIVGGHLYIRHSTDIVTPDWSSAVDIGQQIPGTASTANLPLLAGTYMAKWVDSTGNQSAAATSIITDAPNILAMNFVDAITENPSFSGSKTKVAVVNSAIILNSSETIGEQAGLISTWPRLSALGGISTTGEYVFNGAIDLGSVQTARLTASLKTTGFDALDLISERQLISTWPSVVGTLVNDVWCVLYKRSTNDDPDGMPVWSEWSPLVVGDSTARAWQFKLVLGTDYAAHNIRVSELSVTVDMPDRTESGEDISSGAGVYSVTYSLPFMAVPAIGITAQDMHTGDFYQITSKSESGFDIVFRDSAGTAVSRTFDYISRAY